MAVKGFEKWRKKKRCEQSRRRKRRRKNSPLSPSLPFAAALRLRFRALLHNDFMKEYPLFSHLFPVSYKKKDPRLFFFSLRLSMKIVFR